jgi:hypothetical protein
MGVSLQIEKLMYFSTGNTFLYQSEPTIIIIIILLMERLNSPSGMQRAQP